MKKSMIKKHLRRSTKRAGSKKRRGGVKTLRTKRRTTIKYRHALKMSAGNPPLSEEEKKEVKEAFATITNEIQNVIRRGNVKEIFAIMLKFYDFVISNFYALEQVIPDFETILINHMINIDQWVTLFIKTEANLSKYAYYNLSLRKLVNESKRVKGEVEPFQL